MKEIKRIKGQEASMTDLSRLCGVDFKTVQRWTDEGCPYIKRAVGSGNKWVFDTAEVFDWLRQRDLENAIGSLEQSDSKELERRKLQTQVEKGELELAKQKKELVPFDEVVQAGYEVLSNCKKRLLSIPTKMAPVLAPIHDPNEIHTQLEEVIYQALLELSDFGSVLDEDDLDEDESDSAAA